MLACGVLAVLLTGAGAAGASPAHPTVPAAAPVPSTSSQPLRVALPGLVTVTVDLPRVKIDLLGGRRTAARAPATSGPTPSSTPSAPAPSATTATTARPAPNATPTARVTPSRRSERSSTEPRGNPRRIVTVGDDRDAATGPRRAATVAPSVAAPRPAAEAFEGMLRTGLPIWLLAGIIAMCGLGTVFVVRFAGRRQP